MNPISNTKAAIDLCEAAKSINLQFMGPYERAWSYISDLLPKPEPEEYDEMVARERFCYLNEGQLCSLTTRVKKSFSLCIKPRQQAMNQTKRWFRILWIGSIGYLLSSALRKTFNPLQELDEDIPGRSILGVTSPLSCAFLLYGIIKCFQHPRQVAKSEEILNKTVALREIILGNLNDILQEKVNASARAMAHKIGDQTPESVKSDEGEAGNLALATGHVFGEPK